MIGLVWSSSHAAIRYSIDGGGREAYSSIDFERDSAARALSVTVVHAYEVRQCLPHTATLVYLQFKEGRS